MSDQEQQVEPTQSQQTPQEQNNMEKIIEEYLTIIEQDDQDQDQELTMRETLNIKEHLMYDQDKLRQMNKIVDNKIDYRESIVSRYQHVKEECKQQNDNKAEKIIKEIQNRQRKRFYELEELRALQEKLKTFKIEPPQQQDPKATQSQVVQPTQTKSEDRFKKTQETLIFIRQMQQKERKQMQEQQIQRLLKIQQKKIQDEEQHEQFRVMTEKKQKKVADTLEAMKIWEQQQLVENQIQREEKFKKQQIIQEEKNEKYKQRLVEKQNNKIMQLEYMNDMQKDYQEYNRNSKQDIFKGNELKRQQAEEKKKQEVEMQRKITEDKIKREEAKKKNIEEFKKLQEEMIQKQSIEKLEKTKQILVIIRGQKIVEDKKIKFFEKQEKQEQYKMAFDRFYVTHQNFMKQEKEKTFQYTLQNRIQQEQSQEHKRKDVYLQRVRSQDLTLKQLRRKKQESTDTLCGIQLLRHMQNQNKRYQIQDEQNQKFQNLMEKRLEQQFKIDFYQEEKKKMLEEKQEMAKFVEEEKKRMTQQAFYSKK